MIFNAFFWWKLSKNSDRKTNFTLSCHHPITLWRSASRFNPVHISTMANPFLANCFKYRVFYQWLFCAIKLYLSSSASPPSLFSSGSLSAVPLLWCNGGRGGDIPILIYLINHIIIIVYVHVLQQFFLMSIKLSYCDVNTTIAKTCFFAQYRQQCIHL